MVIDTSAIMAWLKHEPERDRIVTALERFTMRRISAVSLLEVHIVVRSREHPSMVSKLQRFLDEIGAVVMPFDENQALLADAHLPALWEGTGTSGPTQFWGLCRLCTGPFA